jgi:hypothetical protein
MYSSLEFGGTPIGHLLICLFQSNTLNGSMKNCEWYMNFNQIYNVMLSTCKGDAQLQIF